jgi:hypothetical protein
MERRRTLTNPLVRLARAWLEMAGDGPASDRTTRRLGRYTLHEDQLVAVRYIRAAISECGGALLADPPGAGKTIVALAVAREHGDTLVVAPAALRAQWLASAVRASVPIRFVSLEGLSRVAPAHIAPGGLVIVDEAHHARTPATRRYARLSDLCAGARVLLLSATPVINRPRDRDALLALFLGSRATRADAARCVIRRAHAPAHMPHVRRLPSIRLHLTRGDAVRAAETDAAIARAVDALPPPFPAADGAAALELIRITLAMAWSSSLAALDAALRRRVQRGEALADSLRAGHWPSRAALRQWVMGDDATQLAFAGLEPTTHTPPADALATLRRHLEAVRALRAVVQPFIAGDVLHRAAAIESLRAERPQERVVVFARHAATVRALYAELGRCGGVVAIVGERVLAAHGRWHRNEVLDALGPHAPPLRRQDARAIRMLIATDILSEGVELQGVSTVVHADSAWTPATMQQREGRVARPTSVRPAGRSLSGPEEERVVRVARFDPPPEAAARLGIIQRFEAKDRARRRSVREAECRAAVERRMRSWLSGGAAAAPAGRASGDRIAWLAAVRMSTDAHPSDLHLVAATHHKGRWRLRDTPCAIARLTALQALDARPGPSEFRVIRRELARWIRRRTMHELMGDRLPRTAGQGPWRRLRACMDRAIGGTTIAERGRRASSMEHALAVLVRRGGAAVERRVLTLVREASATSMPPGEFESALRTLAALLEESHGEAPAAGAMPNGGPERPRTARNARLVALAILRDDRAMLS